MAGAALFRSPQSSAVRNRTSRVNHRNTGPSFCHRFQPGPLRWDTTTTGMPRRRAATSHPGHSSASIRTIREGRARSSQGPMTPGRSKGAGNAPGTGVRHEDEVTQWGPRCARMASTARCSPRLAPWTQVRPATGNGRFRMWRRAAGIATRIGQASRPIARHIHSMGTAAITGSTCTQEQGGPDVPNHPVLLQGKN